MHIFKVVAIFGFFQACLAFIDPISLSAVGVAALTYFGLSAAVAGTLAAGLATGGIGALLALNGKLKEEGLPQLDDKGEAVILCTDDGTTYGPKFLQSTYCNHVVKGNDGCKVNLQNYKRAGVNYKRYCAAALTNVDTTLHKYQTVWSGAKCKLFVKGETVLTDIDTYAKCKTLFDSK